MHKPFLGKRYRFIRAAIVMAVFVPGAAWSAEITWSRTLELPTWSEIETRLAKPFVESITMVLQKKTTEAIDCRTLLDLRGRGFEPLGDQAHAAERYEGARCLALTLLRTARPAKTSNFVGFKLNPAALGALPPTLSTAFSTIEEDAARRAEAAGKGWLSYEPKIRAKMDQQTLVVSSQVWQSHIEIYARADFDGDGTEDLLVAMDETATEGTFNNTRLFLLTRDRPGAMIRTVKRLQ